MNTHVSWDVFDESAVKYRRFGEVNGLPLQGQTFQVSWIRSMGRRRVDRF